MYKSIKDNPPKGETTMRYDDLEMGVPMQETTPQTFGDYIVIDNAIERGEIKRYRKYLFFGPTMLKRIKKYKL